MVSAKSIVTGDNAAMLGVNWRRSMAVVCTFWQVIPEDEEVFLGYLERSGDVMAHPSVYVNRVFQPPAEIVFEPMRKCIELHDPSQLTFSLRKFTDSSVIEPHQFEGQARLL